jgi:flagellar motor switch protein FliG
MNSYEKGALILMALDKGTAQQLLLSLGDKDMENISACLEKLEGSSVEEIEPALKDFLQYLDRPHSEPLLPSNTILEILNHSDVNQISKMLQNEDETVVAFLLAYLHPSKVAEIIMQWPLEKQTTTIIALSKFDEADKKLINFVRNKLSTKWGDFNLEERKYGGVTFATDCLTYLPSDVRLYILKQMTRDSEFPIGVSLDNQANDETSFRRI